MTLHCPVPDVGMLPCNVVDVPVRLSWSSPAQAIEGWGKHAKLIVTLAVLDSPQSLVMVHFNV